MFFVLTAQSLQEYTKHRYRGVMRTGGQVMVEYLILISSLILGLVVTLGFLREALFEYYRFLVTLVCLPI